MTREVVMIDGMRTAFGRMGGALRPYTPVQLAGMTIKGLCEKTGILERGNVDAVFAGSASGDLNTHNFARYASLLAGLPYETSATFIEMQCGSSIACINNAALQIQAGLIDTAVCGGAEAHSQTYYKYSTAVEPYKGIAPSAAPLRLAPTDEDDLSMIEISDLMAEKWGITREACDEFALRSQTRAAAAIEKGYFKEEILPVEVKYSRKGETVIVDADEHPRKNTNLEGLAKLRPVMEGGVTTAGNASGRNDGAAFVLMMSREKAEELGYQPMAKWITGLDVGVDPKLMGIGPAYSNCKILKREGLSLDDIDVYECNEAFAAQNLSVIRQMENMTGKKIDMENWNPNGGAIAFGHPNGASGARVCIFTMKELERRGGKYGMFSSCCGGGLGISTLIENLR
ncbi:MAG: thiolase family protein [Clostridia bacterium]